MKKKKKKTHTHTHKAKLNARYKTKVPKRNIIQEKILAVYTIIIESKNIQHRNNGTQIIPYIKI
jgi:hypothetical protein